jgi:serine--tRNA ligase
MQQANQSEEARRFWEKVVKGETPGACWVWTGAISSDGSVRIPEALRPYMDGAEVIPAVAAE